MTAAMIGLSANHRPSSFSSSSFLLLPGVVKYAAAQANSELGLLDPKIATLVQQVTVVVIRVVVVVVVVVGGEGRG